MTGPEMFDTDAPVLESGFIADGVYRILLESPDMARISTPGQFAMIEPSPDVFPVTRRPLTISECDPGRGSVGFAFQIVGGGTAALSRLERGGCARMLGPLGRGYSLEGDSWLLVAGGLGSAGFPFLLSRIPRAAVLVGARTVAGIVCCPEDAVVATEDGSGGVRGLVTDLLGGVDWRRYDSIAVCGPAAMMKAVVSAVPADSAHKVQVSMESRMGCGWGVCGGCPVPSVKGGYMSCCKDGPVFRGGDIDWGRVE